MSTADGAVTPAATIGLSYASRQGRQVLLVTVLGSALASIDATVVGIALPAIGRDFGASLTMLQWVVTAYTLALAGLLLFVGTLGDRYGRKRIFLAGVIWFALSSLLCGLAPSVVTLIAARAVQGIRAALLTPGSLALIEASFRPADRGKVIGAWSGLSGVATAIGPFLGGWLVQAVSWRLIFAINVAPLTSTVLAAVPATHAGMASAVNNDVARAAGLIAVAVLPAAAGLTGAAYLHPARFSAGFDKASLISAALCLVGAALAAITIRNHRSAGALAPQRLLHCALDAPPHTGPDYSS
jgi:MFS family permease